MTIRIVEKLFGILEDGSKVKLFTLSNRNGMTVSVSKKYHGIYLFGIYKIILYDHDVAK